MKTLRIYDELCKGSEECGICLYVCKEEVFRPSEALNQKGYRPPVVVHEEQCTRCGNCMIFCPDMAVVVTVRRPTKGAEE